MSGAPLGVLVIGAGDMGERHARGWSEAGAVVRGVYDPDRRRAAAVAEAVGAAVVDEVEAALADPELQVASVCTPTYLHADYTVAALNAGKHVLCEKPVALTLFDAERMRDAERASGCCLRIGFMRRFDPASHQILAFRQRIGDPVLAQATLAAGVRPKLLMHDAHANGGPIIDMCCHLFDQWVRLFGERPAVVRAHGYTFSENKPQVADIPHKALDSAHIALRYPSGGVGQIQVSWGLPAGVAPTERHAYMGPDGLIAVDWPQAVTLHSGASTLQWHPPAEDPWRAEIRAFHHELRGLPHPPLATVDDGIEALRTSLAVLVSVAEQRDVRPAEVSGRLPVQPERFESGSVR